MNVKDLKEILNQFPEDTEILACGAFMGFHYSANIEKVVGTLARNQKDVIKTISVEFSKADTCFLVLDNLK